MLAFASSSPAALMNGGFESGSFGGWDVAGFTSMETSDYGTGPTEGSNQALLENGRDFFAVDQPPDEIDPTTGISDGDLESFLNLETGRLDGLVDGNATEGSAIRQGVTVGQNWVLSYDWNLLTDEDAYNDFAFLSVTGNGGTQVIDSVFPGGTFNPDLGTSEDTRFINETGFSTGRYVFPEAGTYTIGFGVLDVDGDPADDIFLGPDTFVDTGLLVDNVQVAVPLPSTFALVGCGLIVLGGGRRSRRAAR